jgi:hypothetical protein
MLEGRTLHGLYPMPKKNGKSSGGKILWLVHSLSEESETDRLSLPKRRFEALRYIITGKNSTIPIPINPRGIELVFEFVDQQEHKVVAKLQLSDTQLIQRYALVCIYSATYQVRILYTDMWRLDKVPFWDGTQLVECCITRCL